MGPKTDTRTIGDREFTVTALTGWSSFKMSRKLGAILGPTLGKALGGVGNLDVGTVLNQEAGELLKSVGGALEGFFEHLSEAELVELTKTLLANATVKVEGKEVRVLDGFDLLFHGQASEIWQLLFFAIEVNYGDFFELLAGLGQKLSAGSAKGKESKTSPTG